MIAEHIYLGDFHTSIKSTKDGYQLIAPSSTIRTTKDGYELRTKDSAIKYIDGSESFGAGPKGFPAVAVDLLNQHVRVI